ncbi:PIG-M-domain-containing protein [Lentinula novae-zelandiae]|nr:PIG-M-domain-containing protein [Lentinula novae-zelandiae]
MSTFVLLSGFCYLIWGYPFLYESYLYHLHRLDHRHNFSPYFYLTYLTYPNIHEGAFQVDSLSPWTRMLQLSLTGFVPQMTLASPLPRSRSTISGLKSVQREEEDGDKLEARRCGTSPVPSGYSLAKAHEWEATDVSHKHDERDFRAARWTHEHPQTLLSPYSTSRQLQHRFKFGADQKALHVDSLRNTVSDNDDTPDAPYTPHPTASLTRSLSCLLFADLLPGAFLNATGLFGVDSGSSRQIVTKYAQ